MSTRVYDCTHDVDTVCEETQEHYEARMRRLFDQKRSHDSNYEYIQLSGSKQIVEIFGSGPRGSFIRNAVTGASYYDCRVGSKAEDGFFKVTDSTGFYGRKTPLILFYDNPEQYEAHRSTTLHENVKKVWYKKTGNFYNVSR